MNELPQPVAKVQYKGKDLLYAVANSHCEWRVRSLFSKEPDTIAWIQSMRLGETFVDIGANIGVYTIFAAAHGLKVYAFEPESSNYALLCKSILINGLDDLAAAYCLALTDKQQLDTLYLSTYLPGGSCHTFGENIDHRLEVRGHSIKQGCMSVRLDDLGLRADHVKIDVDGLEHEVIRGGEFTISEAKSVLCEINSNLPQHVGLMEKMKRQGWVYSEEQVAAARRTEGPFKGCGNVIWRRQ